MRRAFVVNAGWSARKDQPIGFDCCDFSRGRIEMNNLRIHLTFAYSPRYDLRVLRAKIEDENFRVCWVFRRLHILRMRLRYPVLRGRIVGTSLHWPKRSLTGHAALELLLHFLRAALFERVCAAAQGQPCDRERNANGPHLLIL